MPSTVDVVIVTYHSAATLDRCLASLTPSLLNQQIIIDNTNSNRGFAQAANLGAAQATAPYLFFLNPDAILMPGALESAVRYLADHPATAIAGLALHDNLSHLEPNSFGSLPTFRHLLFRHFAPSSQPSQPANVGWVSGAALLIRRHIFQALGGFDSNFFMYWEDVDLCHRAHQAGHSIVFLPSAVVIHQRGASSRDPAQKTAHYDASADKYFRKHYATTIWLFQRWLRHLYRLFWPLAP